MKIFTLIFSLILTNLTFAQSKGELVVFSNLGEHFYLLLNGERQNADAATNVKVQEVLPGFYSCKVISQNNLYALSTNLEIKAGMRVTYRIVEKKGVPKLRYYTEQVLETTSKPIAGQCVLVYGQTPVVQNTTTTQTTTTQTANNGSVSNGANVNMSGTGVSANVGSNNAGGTTSATTQTTNQGTIQNGTIGGEENINISINMSETGFSTNVNTNGNGNQNMSTSGNVNGTSTTTTTTTTTSNTTVGGNPDYKPKPVAGKPTNCLVDAPGMSTAIAMIKKESFADNKMSVAKQFTKVKCLTVLQIKEIAMLFDFSDDKMEYVKFAYDHCMNTSDYYQLSDVFSFSDDKDDFNGFLLTK